MNPHSHLFSISYRVSVIAFFLLVAVAIGAAQTPVVTLSRASVSLNSTVVGVTSASRSVTVTNTGVNAVTVTVSPATGDFAQTNTCGSALAGGGQCVITITFTPTATGTRTGTITVTDTVDAAAQTINLRGTGIYPVTLSSTSRNFGSVPVGTTSATQTFSVTNNLTTAVSLTITTAVPFAITPTSTCATSLGGGASCTVNVTFSPSTTGPQNGSVVVNYGALLGSPQSVTVQGTGIFPVTVSPTSRSFGNVAIGTTSAPLAFTVRNYLTTSISLAITTNTPFAIASTSTCGTSLAASTTCTIAVTFAPTVTGLQTGSVTVNYGTLLGSPQSISVQGNGILPIAVSPTSRSFGSVALLTTSAVRTFTVTNYQTTTAAVTVSTAAPFAETDNCASIAANGSCTINATFTPTVTGLQSGAITITYSGLGSPQSVSVTGTGVLPLAALPTSVTFPALRSFGTSSSPRTVTLSNNTTAAIALDSIAISPAAYAITANTCTGSLGARASCVVTIVFTPTVTGTTTGTLTITYGSTNTQLLVPLTGSVQVNNLFSIAVTAPNASLAAGLAEQLTATGTYFGGATGNVTSIAAWSSSNAAVASVGSTTGLLTGVSAGTATITASVTESNGTTVSGRIVVTITPKAITSVSVSAPSSSIYPLGTDQFTATANYTDGSTGPVAAAFASSNIGVATINSTTGLATGVLSTAGGTTNITATVSGAPTSSPFVLAVAGVLSVVVTPATPTFPLGMANAALPFGPTNNTLQFTATATYTDNTTVNVTTAATWQSSAINVATVNAAGTAIVTVPAGSLTGNVSTTISASYGNTGSTLLTVQPPILELLAVCLGPYPSAQCGTSTASVGTTLGLNGTQQFSAVGNYSDGSSQNLTSLATWTSTNPQEVTVNTTGLATVVATDNAAHSVTASYGTFVNQDSNTAWITASTTAPISCPSPTIDMKLLVVNNSAANTGAGYADFPAIQQILNYVGVPYDVVDVSASAPTLSDGACHGHYQGVVFAYGGDYYSIGSWQQTLINYETTFKVRHLNWYSVPDPNFGLSYTGTQIPSTQSYTTNFTAAAASVFFYANTTTPLTITNAAADLASAAPAAGGTLTPLLQDASGNIVSAIYNNGKGQTFLSQTFDSNPYLLHNLVVAYGLVYWVTNGVFLGDYHVYATQQVDDFFINDSEWIPSTPCLSNPLQLDRTSPGANNLPVFRVNSADMTQLTSWQTGIQNDPSGLFKQFQLTIAFNGVGTAGNGDWTGLTAPIISSSATNGVATFTGQYFTGLPGQSVTVTNTTNGGGVLNGTYTIVSVTPGVGSAGPPIAPGTATFTVNISSTIPTLQPAPENGLPDNPATATATVADDLVSNLQSYQGAFHWISHTYDHPATLNGMTKSTPDVNGDDIDLEVLTNQWVATSPGGVNLDVLNAGLKQLTFTDFNPANIVTPGITGLNDPNVPGYLYADGIHYAVSDASKPIGQANNGPNPSPNVGIVNSYETGIYEVPRRPNDIFYNTASWADDEAEFVCIYQYYVPPNSPPGTLPAPDPPFNTYNAAQILDFVSSSFVTNMLMGDMDPEMFHQPDLHFSDNYPALTAQPFGPPNPPVNIPGLASPHVSSLLTDTYDLTFTKYKAVYKLPVLTPTLDQLGVLMQNRNSFNLSGVTASIVGAGTASAQISLTVPSTATVPTAVVPVTGLTSTGSESYGGQNISHITMAPGQTINFPLP